MTLTCSDDTLMKGQRTAPGESVARMETVLVTSVGGATPETRASRREGASHTFAQKEEGLSWPAGPTHS